MRLPVPALAAVVLVTACSSGSSPPPVQSPQQTAPSAPVEIVFEESEPEPLPDLPCDEVASMLSVGDHKPAVDEMDEIVRAGSFCSEEVLAATEASRRLLAEADALIHSSTEKKRLGDVSGARADLQGAVDLYPRYYWARKLLRDLGEGPGPEAPEARETSEAIAQTSTAEPPAKTQPRSESQSESQPDVAADVELIRQLIAEQNLELARLAEQQGDLEAASHWTITAIKAEPGDGELKRGIVEYARLLGLKFFSAGELSPAREIWGAAFALDESDARLRDYLRQVDERLANLEQIRSKGGS